MQKALGEEVSARRRVDRTTDLHLGLCVIVVHNLCWASASRYE